MTETERSRAKTRIAFRTLAPEEILSEEAACVRRHPTVPLRPAWETAITDLSRNYLRTRARLQHVFVGKLSYQSLLVETPHGLAVVWRLWGNTLQVVLGTLQADSTVQFKPGVVDIPADQVAECHFVLDRILTEPLPWSH